MELASNNRSIVAAVGLLQVLVLLLQDLAEEADAEADVDAEREEADAEEADVDVEHLLL